MINGGSQTWVQALIADLVDVQSAAIWRDYARAGRLMDGTAPVAAPFTVTSAGEITAAGQSGASDRAHGCYTGPVTGDPRGVPVTLAEAAERGYAPGATVQALRMDRYRSDKGDLPDGLRFPEPIAEVAPGQTELFWSGEITEFNAARRGRRVA